MVGDFLRCLTLAGLAAAYAGAQQQSDFKNEDLDFKVVDDTGTTTTIRHANFDCTTGLSVSSTSRYINLKQGAAAVAFPVAKISSIEFLGPKSIRLHLVDGTVKPVELDDSCFEVSGKTDLGEYQLRFEHTKSIEILRARPAPAKSAKKSKKQP